MGYWNSDIRKLLQDVQLKLLPARHRKISLFFPANGAQKLTCLSPKGRVWQFQRNESLKKQVIERKKALEVTSVDKI